MIARLPVRWRWWLPAVLVTAGVGAAFVLHRSVGWSDPNPAALGLSRPAAALSIGVLVFREGLECVLVLAAVSAGVAVHRDARRQIAAGVGAGFVATLVTWLVAVRALDDLGRNVSALALQAATGLLGVMVLLVVMNWFFHRFYWTGWIAAHNRRRDRLLAKPTRNTSLRLLGGMWTLGFTSFYREGFEVVLFLQGYRLRLGGAPVAWGLASGMVLTALVAAATFVAHRKLPYRRMLVTTGVLLGLVLLVMVGEEAQEMQLAHWIGVTNIAPLARVLPAWMPLWLSIFPTVQTLVVQAGAVLLVLGSYRYAASGGGLQRAAATPGRVDPTALLSPGCEGKAGARSTGGAL